MGGLGDSREYGSGRVPRHCEIARPYVLISALVLLVAGCDTGGGRESPTAVSSPGVSLPSIPTPRRSTVAPSAAQQTIVSFRLSGGPHARPVDLTFSGADGVPVTVEGASPGTWSKVGFWPVGASISMSATTDDAGNRDFSCVISANGTVYASAAKPRSEGNNIVGWDCEVGPLIVESAI